MLGRTMRSSVHTLLMSGAHVFRAAPMGSASVRTFGVSPIARCAPKAAKPTKPVKPRAAKASQLRKSKSVAAPAAAVLALACGVGYMFYDPEKTPRELFDEYVATAMSRFREAADPDVAFLQNSLPPAPPVPPDYDIPTIFLAMEDVILLRQWDRKYGFRYQKRPGVEALLQGLTKQGFEIVFWSKYATSSAEEPLVKLIQSVPGQLSVSGVLGREHQYVRDNQPEKKIQFLPRKSENMIVVDCDMKTYTNQPNNTLIVPAMEEFHEEDQTLYTVLAFATMYRAERSKKHVSDIRSFLRELHVASGSSGDPKAMIESFEQMAKEKRLKREEEMTTGLGGVLRGLQQSNRALRGGRVVSHSNVNPNLKVPEGSLMDRQRERLRERMRKNQEAAEKRMAEAQARDSP